MWQGPAHPAPSATRAFTGIDVRPEAQTSGSVKNGGPKLAFGAVMKADALESDLMGELLSLRPLQASAAEPPAPTLPKPIVSSPRNQGRIIRGRPKVVTAKASVTGGDNGDACKSAARTHIVNKRVDPVASGTSCGSSLRLAPRLRPSVQIMVSE